MIQRAVRTVKELNLRKAQRKTIRQHSIVTLHTVEMSNAQSRTTKSQTTDAISFT